MSTTAETSRFARVHASVLATSWLLATVVALYAYAVAPMGTAGPATAETMAGLRGAWPWYTLCYALFFVADVAIGLLGVLLMAWLSPRGGYRALAMVVLFALAGALGLAMDVTMLVAAQLFRSASSLFDAASAPLFLAYLNASTAWFSAGSFLLSGCASWLVCPLAERAGGERRWIAFTRTLAIYQIAVSAVLVAATLSAAPVLGWLAIASGVIVMPILASLWLVSLLREMRRMAAQAMIS
jgi:hypothetical protein